MEICAASLTKSRHNLTVTVLTPVSVKEATAHRTNLTHFRLAVASQIGWTIYLAAQVSYSTVEHRDWKRGRGSTPYVTQWAVLTIFFIDLHMMAVHEA